VLVEGALDALRVVHYADTWEHEVYSVALLGSGISREAAANLSRFFDHIMVCLDPNMWPIETMKVVKQFRLYPTTAQATTLSVDPKDASNSELCDLMKKCEEMVR
jgi:hypothetical protein